jgi:hypothetical protein
MSFLPAKHLATLADRVHVDGAFNPKLLVPELLDRLDELDAPSVIDSPGAFNEACAVSAALRYTFDYLWHRRDDQKPDFTNIAQRVEAIGKLAAPYSRKHIIRAADDRHAAAFLICNRISRHEASLWAAVQRLIAIGALRKGRIDGETWDRAFVCGYDAPIRSSETTSDDQGRNWPNYMAVPDLLAIPTEAHVSDEVIQALPPLEAHHTIVRAGTRVGEARHPPLTQFMQTALRRFMAQYPLPTIRPEAA